MKPIRSIKTKLIIRITIAFILLSMVLQTTVYLSFRKLSIENAQDKAKTVADLTRDAITSFMVLGVYDKLNVFLDRLKYTYGLKELKILRGTNVIRQFGNISEKGQVISALESEVLATGKPKSRLYEKVFAVEYSLVIPYKADSDQKVRCISCHQAREGELLGAISLVMDLSSQRQQGIHSIYYMVAISLIFSMGTLYLVYVFFKPYTELFQRLRHGFQKTQYGDFSESINVHLLDEAGDVANGFNLMSKNLSQTLSSISHRVSLLIGYEVSKSGNAIIDTANTIDNLVKIYYFKRTIEKDSSKLDVFLRFQHILTEMSITTFCIYEINNEKDVMSILSCGDPSQGPPNSGDVPGSHCYCSDVIFKNAQECRAKRAGGIVDSREFTFICLNFTPPMIMGDVHLCHYCIPLYVGGRVGYVIQLIYPAEVAERFHSVIPYVKSYLQEGESVIEAKTFMELLKEQSLVDQLTKLYNRRFLDEVGPKLSAQALRRKTTLGILMIDIDLFKQVNDNHGHDVGDVVVKTVAWLIKTSVRKSDIVVRYGGEEILVILVDVLSTRALDVAEKIRKEIEQRPIEHPSVVLKKTVSIGVSEFPTHAEDFWQCVKCADIALYKAKGDGRNRAYAFSKDMMEDTR
ncbi:MAG: diguanylate cyclase [Nitrospirae bacterium]|nr:diguanylate cyclase [Nitrospirota bacterium]MBF0592414.1 diguanylate cyclase [Nitrospirota bacterium]